MGILGFPVLRDFRDHNMIIGTVTVGGPQGEVGMACGVCGVDNVEVAVGCKGV